MVLCFLAKPEGIQSFAFFFFMCVRVSHGGTGVCVGGSMCKCRLVGHRTQMVKLIDSNLKIGNSSSLKGYTFLPVKNKQIKWLNMDYIKTMFSSER